MSKGSRTWKIKTAVCTDSRWLLHLYLLCTAKYPIALPSFTSPFSGRSIPWLFKIICCTYGPKNGKYFFPREAKTYDVCGKTRSGPQYELQLHLVTVVFPFLFTFPSVGAGRLKQGSFPNVPQQHVLSSLSCNIQCLSNILNSVVLYKTPILYYLELFSACSYKAAHGNIFQVIGLFNLLVKRHKSWHVRSTASSWTLGNFSNHYPLNWAFSDTVKLQNIAGKSI